MTTVEDEATAAPAKMTLPTLTAMVVGSMVGAGVFFLPARFAGSTGVAGAIIAWLVAGTGMLMLAFVFQTLAIRKPDLDSGIFAYAKAGFGDYIGFNSAFGYWASACVGNTFYWVFIMATIGAAFPALGDGDTLLAAALSTVGVWTFHFLITRGVKNAAVVNRIVTIAKIVPILVFLVILVFAFDAGVFSDNFWGGKAATIGSIFNQVKATMIITVFVFLGIEGASVYSRYATRRTSAAVDGLRAGKRRRPLGCGLHQRWRSCLSAGCLPGLDPDGGRSALHPRHPRRHATFPQAREQSEGADHRLDLVQLIRPAHDRRGAVRRGCIELHVDLCTSLALIPYLLSAAYAFKLAVTKETYANDPSRIRESSSVSWRSSTPCSWWSRPALSSCCCPASSTPQAPCST
jgi:hypothetical protein